MIWIFQEMINRHNLNFSIKPIHKVWLLFKWCCYPFNRLNLKRRCRRFWCIIKWIHFRSYLSKKIGGRKSTTKTSLMSAIIKYSFSLKKKGNLSFPLITLITKPNYVKRQMERTKTKHSQSVFLAALCSIIKLLICKNCPFQNNNSFFNFRDTNSHQPCFFRTSERWSFGFQSVQNDS